jgi:hypothetical protein
MNMLNIFPTKITKGKWRFLEVVDKNPRLFLQEVTIATDVGLGRFSVIEILSNSSFV